MSSYERFDTNKNFFYQNLVNKIKKVKISPCGIKYKFSKLFTSQVLFTIITPKG